jgi:hypothetical protein
MKRLIRLFVGALIPAFIFAAIPGQPAVAQDKAKDATVARAPKGKALLKVLLENDETQVYEITFRPGDEGENVERPYRVIHAVRGGTLERIYADGKTERTEWKTGEVRAVAANGAYTPKNVGKTTLVLFVVTFKHAK